ncbi:MAG: hypothetical protein WBO32_02515 [Cyclobacteriaceae bacterium]
MTHLYTIAKYYVLASFDLLLFALAAWDGIDHGLRTIAAIGAIIVLYFTIKKIKKDIELKSAMHEREKILLEKEQQELNQLIAKAKSDGKEEIQRD